MTPLFTVLRWIALTAATLALLLAVFLLGFWIGTTHGGGEPAATEAQVWTCSMHPQVRQPEPGDCPICSMELIPAEDPRKKPEKKKKYACSMFCVPPLDAPGKCPVCGMDMVEVGGEDTGPGNAPRLRTSERARKLAEIRTTAVERKFVTAVIRMVGKVDFDETRKKTLTAWVPGRIDRLYADYTGLEVKKGDELASLYSPDLISAQEELVQALKAAKDFDKSTQPLMKKTARDMVAAARKKLRNLGLTPDQVAAVEASGKASDHVIIHAPLSGIVVDKNAQEGMYVRTGTRIYTIADLSWVWVKLDVYESDLAWIRYGQQVEFETEAYPGDVFRGRIAFIDQVLTARTRSVKVRVSVANPDGRLKPDMFVRARVRSRIAAGGRVMDPDLAGKWISPRHPEIIKDEAGVCDRCGIDLVRAEDLGYVLMDPDTIEAPLVIPASAPLITGKRAVVYVEVEGEAGVFEGREIGLGGRAGDSYLVRWGLEEGDMVVVNGAFKIDSAIQIRAGRSMMNPEKEPGTAAPRKQTLCPVSGNDIDEDVFTDHEGKRVYFCCPHCIKKFKSDPGSYLAKMKDQGIKVENTPEARSQTHCPVMGNEIQKEVYTDHEGKRIYFCCPPCIEKFKADPGKYLRKMEEEGVRPEDAPGTDR